MSATARIAEDEMLAVIAGILPSLPGVVVKWPGEDGRQPPSQGVDWLGVGFNYDDGGQGSLSGPVSGSTRWQQDGFITVRCFGRVAVGGRARAREMACAVRDAFRGRATVSGVWFRGQTIRDVGIDKGWYQFNAIIPFEYDEVIPHV